MTSKQKKIIAALLILFAAAVAVLLFLNRGTMEAGQAAQRDRTLSVTSNGEVICVLDFSALQGLPAETFETTVRSHGMKPEAVTYRGVEIHKVLEAAGIEPKGKDVLYFKGADTYLATVKAEELSEYDTIYVVYEKNGERMALRSENGEGPYQVVLLSDSFSQRWCKFLSEIEWKQGEE